MRNLRFWENIIKINKINIGQIILNVDYLKTSVGKQLLIQFFFFYKPVSKQNFGQKL